MKLFVFYNVFLLKLGSIRNNFLYFANLRFFLVMTTVLPLPAFRLTKRFNLRKLCKDFDFSLDKLLLISLLLKLSKEENNFDLTVLVWRMDKSVFLTSWDKSSKINIKSAYSSLLGGIANSTPLYQTDFSLSLNL